MNIHSNVLADIRFHTIAKQILTLRLKIVLYNITQMHRQTFLNFFPTRMKSECVCYLNIAMFIFYTSYLTLLPSNKI